MPSPIGDDPMEGILQTLYHEIEKKKLSKIILIGYSMGGRIALAFAHKFPTLIEHLIILSANPGIESDLSRNVRMEEDLKWIELLEEKGLNNFLTAWYDQPLFAPLRGKEKLFAEVLLRRKEQNVSSLKDILLRLSPAKQPSFWKILKNFPFPTLFLFGECDMKYRVIAKSLSEIGCGITVDLIANSGHAVHLENPKSTYKKIREKLMTTQITPKKSIEWKSCNEYTDITYHKYSGIAKITINRPEIHNAFRPLTAVEMLHALEDARNDQKIGVIILTGAGSKAFCSGGDQRIRGDAGYSDQEGVHRLNILDFQRALRACPKPSIAMVAGYAIGGGHVLQVMCDLTIAADHSLFGQTGPKVGSFDGGYGASYLARIVGQKKAREIWYLCRQYTAAEALQMGLINHVVPYEDLESTTIEWCEKILEHSPLAIRCLKAALNADCDGQAGLQELAGNATLLFYMSEEAQEGHQAFLEKRKPDFSQFPKRP